MNESLQLETGCWIDGHWGRYGTARLVQIAESLGYSDSVILSLAYRDLKDDPELAPEEFEALMDAGDEVENWLNEHVAQEGYSFAWVDGEFFYMENSWWEE